MPKFARQNFEIPSGDIPVTFGQTVLARINYDPITELFETVVGTPSYAFTLDGGVTVITPNMPSGWADGVAYVEFSLYPFQ